MHCLEQLINSDTRAVLVLISSPSPIMPAHGRSSIELLLFRPFNHTLERSDQQHFNIVVFMVGQDGDDKLLSICRPCTCIF